MKHYCTRENIWQLLLGFTLCSFAFHQRINSWGIGLLLVFFLADKKLIQKIKQPIDIKKIFPLASFFFLYVIFYLFSDKDGIAFQSMFSKISFFLLPLLLAYESYFTPPYQQKLLLAFSIALSLGFLFTFFNSYFVYYHNVPNASHYSWLSRMNLSAGIMHPGYYSNYFMLAIVWHYFLPSRYRIFFIVFFSIVLLLLISRIVMLFYILFTIGMIIKFISKSKKPLLTAGLFIIISIFTSLTLYQIPSVKNRVDETISGLMNTSTDVDYSAATASRTIAYQEELKMVKTKPIWGYGLGNANEALQAQLQKSGYYALAENMHTHNQFFNTWFHTGIIGFLWLCFLLIFLARHFYKKKNDIAFWFTLLVAMNLLTDDMLEIQAGIVFFALIWSLNLFSEPAKITA